MNKSLLIPYIPELDELPLDEAVNVIEERGTRCSIDSVNWPKEFAYHPLTVVNAAHSGEAIYLDFFVRCNYLRAMNYKNNTAVWEDSSVAFLIQPKPDGEFWNIDINCIGAINAAHRLPGQPIIPLTDSEIDSIKRYASCGPNPFREVEGLFSWNVAARISLSLIGAEYTGTPLLMKGNFCKCASGTSQPHFLTWNPVTTLKPDFLTPEFFGDIILQ